MYRAYSIIKPARGLVNVAGKNVTMVVGGGGTTSTRSYSRKNKKSGDVDEVDGQDETSSTLVNEEQEQDLINQKAYKLDGMLPQDQDIELGQDEDEDDEESLEDDDDESQDESEDEDDDWELDGEEEDNFDDLSQEEIKEIKEAREAAKQKKLSYLGDFEGFENMTIDKDYKEEIKVEERQIEQDIDKMIANADMRELKLMRWGNNEEILQAARREHVPLKKAFKLDETTEQVQKRIKQKEDAELAGSKFNSVRINYQHVSESKTSHIAKVLDSFKSKYEKPLVELYEKVTEEENVKWRMVKSEKKRIYKLKLKENVKTRLSSLERQYRDLVYVKNALSHSRLNKSRLERQHVEEVWQRMLERSRILDPFNLMREVMSDEYNDLGEDSQFTDAYVTQLAMIPFDFANPRSYISISKFYDTVIDSIDESSTISSPIDDMMTDQTRLAADIDRLRTLGFELSAEELAKHVAENPVQSLIAESDQQIAGREQSLAEKEEQDRARYMQIDQELRDQLDATIGHLANKIASAEDYRVVPTINDAKGPFDMLNLSKSALENIKYDQELYLKIAHPKEKTVVKLAEGEDPKAAVRKLRYDINVLEAKRVQLLEFKKPIDGIDSGIEELKAKIQQIEAATSSQRYTEIFDEDPNMPERQDGDEDFDDEEGSNLKKDKKAIKKESTQESNQVQESSGEVVEGDQVQEGGEQVKVAESSQEIKPYDGGDDELSPLDNMVKTPDDKILGYQVAVDDHPDFEMLASELVGNLYRDVNMVAAKYVNEPINEKTASDVIEELYGMHKENNIFNSRAIKHDQEVLRDAYGDVNIPTAVAFQYDVTNRDLVDRDVRFNMPPKDTDLVRMLSLQLSEFGLLNQEKVLAQAPDNVPFPRQTIEENPDHFPDIMEHIDEYDEEVRAKVNANALANNSNIKPDDIPLPNDKKQAEVLSPEHEAIYDERRLYTNLLPIFKEEGVLAVPLRKRGNRVAIDTLVRPTRQPKTESELEEERQVRREFRSHDSWLFGRPFDLAKYRLNGQTSMDAIEPQMDHDVSNPWIDHLNQEVETYRFFQEGRGEEWFGPERVGDDMINRLNRRMDWYPREHSDTYPVQFIVSHNTQDQTAEDFWSNRKVIMRVNVAALDLPPVVEARLAELTLARFDAQTRTLKLVSNNHKSQDDNKHQCKVLFNNLLHEAYLADPNFVSVRSNQYRGETPEPSNFLPSTSARQTSKFNLFRLTGFPTMFDSQAKLEILNQLSKTKL